MKNALVGEDLSRMQAACDDVVREMMGVDPHRIGNRGSHRYSFGPGGSCAPPALPQSQRR